MDFLLLSDSSMVQDIKKQGGSSPTLGEVDALLEDDANNLRSISEENKTTSPNSRKGLILGAVVALSAAAGGGYYLASPSESQYVPMAVHTLVVDEKSKLAQQVTQLKNQYNLAVEENKSLTSRPTLREVQSLNNKVENLQSLLNKEQNKVFKIGIFEKKDLGYIIHAQDKRTSSSIYPTTVLEFSGEKYACNVGKKDSQMVSYNLTSNFDDFVKNNCLKGGKN